MYFVLVALILSCTLANGAVDIDKLLESMTIEEKCGQMTQINFDVIQKSGDQTNYDENPINITKLEYAIKQKHIGSILNAPYNIAQKSSTWQKAIKTVQNVAQQTKNKIPIIYGIDSIHGAHYIQESILFPHAISLAGSFNSEVAKKIAEIVSIETRAVGIPWNFNPVLDVGRQPIWPRLFETYGEDPYLVGKMGEAFIQGSQGNDIKNRTKVATCLKHYIGYSLPFNGKDRTPAYIPENMLREVFLPPFEKAIAAGSPTVMVNSGEVNGIPGHANYHYLTEILKGELNFSGFVVSDWEDIKRLHYRDKLAENDEEAVRIAVMAGLDMSMVPYDYSFADYCVNLAKKDAKFSARVDDATRRILKVKNDLGLFENSQPFAEDLNKIGTMESHNTNVEAARETIVLAKNDGTLPLNANENKKILVAGPTGNVLRVLNGGWSYVWQGSVEELFVNFGTQKKTTIFEEVNKLTPNNSEYSQGANFDQLTNLDETVAKAKNADIIILTIGEDSYCEGFGNIDNLMLSESQQVLADRLLELNKPVVLVYIGGRPRIITTIAQRSSAVLIGFLPGEKGSIAIAEILFGKYNPNARLSVSYPLNVNGITTYDYKPMEVYDANKLYTFGHGLSYTKFEYSNLRLSTKSIGLQESLTISVNVKNSGQMDGKESVLLFLNDEYASVTRPVRQLKGFEKVSLKIGESVDVKFNINSDDLSFINTNNQRVVEQGKFSLFVGSLSDSFSLIVDKDVTTSQVQTTTTTSQVKTTTTSSKASSISFNLFMISIINSLLFLINISFNFLIDI